MRLKRLWAKVGEESRCRMQFSEIVGNHDVQITGNGSLPGKEKKDLPHHMLCLISLKEKLSVRRAI
jgi:hypothetical protein